MTSKRICVTSSGREFIFYRAECSCGSDNHAHIIEISKADANLGCLEMSFYSTQVDRDWWKVPNKDNPYAIRNMWWAFKRRIRFAFNILFRGYFETEVDFMFNGEDQIRDYIKALEEGLEHVKTGMKEREEQRKKSKQPKDNARKEGDMI